MLFVGFRFRLVGGCPVIYLRPVAPSSASTASFAAWTQEPVGVALGASIPLIRSALAFFSPFVRGRGVSRGVFRCGGENHAECFQVARYRI